MAMTAMVGVAAAAFAARMDWSFERHVPSARPVTTAASGAAATGTRVNGSQSLLPWGSLTLSGDVVELSTAGAPFTVTVSDGNRSYLTRINGNGYTAVLGGYPPGSPDRMITVEVRSTRVHYISVLGSRSRLSALAGADRFLTLQEQPRLRVSPFSTALAELVKFQLGGRDAANDDEFERGVGAIYAQDLSVGSALIARVASGQWALPAGYTDGLAMLQDRQYFRSLSADIAKRDEALAYLGDEAAFTPLAQLTDLAATTIFHGTVPVNGPQLRSSYAMVLERQGADTYDLFETEAFSNPRYSALLAANGSVDLQPQATIAIDYGGVTRNYLGYRLRRLFKGERISQWSIRLQWQEVQAGGVTTTGTDYIVMQSRDLDAWRKPQGWAGVSELPRTLPWICAESSLLQDCGYAQYQPEGQAGGTLTNFGHAVSYFNFQILPLAPGLQPRFQPLTVDASGGLRVLGDTADTTFWRVGDDSALRGTVVYKSRGLTGAAAGKVSVGVGYTVQQSEDAAPPSLEGTWIARDPAAMSGFYGGKVTLLSLQRNADYSGLAREFDGQAESAQNTFTWEWWSNRAAIVDQHFVSSSVAATCEALFATGATQCETRVSYFHPVLREGSRYYGVENIYLARRTPTSSSMRYVSSQAGFQDCVSGPCLGAPAAMQRAAFARPKRIAERAAFQR